MGGTGLEYFELTEQRVISVETPYGTVEPVISKLGKHDLVFMSRHGRDHATPPHLVNYRGNIWALRELGVRKVVATAAVGSLSPNYHLGELVLLDQFLDFTKSRPQTFYEGGQQGVLHVDMTEPYCSEMRQLIVDASKHLGLVVKNGACYVCTEGPRFETPAEIRMFQHLGADLVGMTSVPEVVLARELGMCYASIGMVTNEAAGIADHPLSHAEVMKSIKELEINVAQLIQTTFELLTPSQKCLCALANAEVGKF
ncbi:S-methyl-5'-thioinosine phosphorylase [Desulfosporosinus nitroreducens]|uniref:Probable 6-oxopurine nucleoside phosphorylase n=1 Tax=Desulfosporosinus nitroreducens TaxID=2018668 RepID=A0ABT8QNF6_9FIRM|nr:S-methyl-5'-thioinosine phosphorylase [Desulfosporosinus nitroreducens]MCO1601124.1 S-methyl-5'-thioinosine phosphorylase [Desulfosporosinus nitroreducens]MDO0821628.1 S-methyl-5'-thioinosine phosphorylase [Desulfosporosinus nitroreducens]